MVQSGPKQHSKIVDAMISHRLDRSDPGFSIRFGIFDEPGAPQPRNVTIAHLVVKRTRDDGCKIPVEPYQTGVLRDCEIGARLSIRA
ncbi:hypothetical protein [Xanthobacter sp. 126]|uniref:hypothetical protein n=1 Tax=Xanthobacter sp. 126 TaxID=1131814 RepID=UPI0012DEF083|nr:hypothetical protein [Xanthobacter sp. 126]